MGVRKKIAAQIAVFSREFSMTEIEIEKEETNIVKSFTWRFPGKSYGRCYEKAYNQIDSCAMDNLQFIYLRKLPLDKRYMDFLAYLKAKAPRVKIIMEIPTYPYDYELLQNVEMMSWYFKDRHCRKYLAKYIDRIVTYSRDKYIFEVPTINAVNGIDTNGIVISRDRLKRKLSNNILNMIAVAQFQKSHGYERVLRGLAKYYDSGHVIKVILHMVGDGKEKEYYQRVVDRLGISDYVLFYGKKQGNELEEIYNRADIALGCFGLYKRRIRSISSLKIGEYLIHGLPVVSGVKETLFEGIDSEYYLELPNDSSNVCINDIVSFYNDLLLKHSSEEIHDSIIQFARNNVDLSVTMKPIMEYIE